MPGGCDGWCRVCFGGFAAVVMWVVDSCGEERGVVVLRGEGVRELVGMGRDCTSSMRWNVR